MKNYHIWEQAEAKDRKGLKGKWSSNAELV
jgi:hypothetical protein